MDEKLKQSRPNIEAREDLCFFIFLKTRTKSKPKQRRIAPFPSIGVSQNPTRRFPRISSLLQSQPSSHFFRARPLSLLPIAGNASKSLISHSESIDFSVFCKKNVIFTSFYRSILSKLSDCDYWEWTPAACLNGKVKRIF